MNMNEMPHVDFKVPANRLADALKDAEELILHDPKYENVVLHSKDPDKDDSSKIILRFKGEQHILARLGVIAKTWH